MDARVAANVASLRHCRIELIAYTDVAKKLRDSPTADHLLDYDAWMYKLWTVRERIFEALNFIVQNPGLVGSSSGMQACILPESSVAEARRNLEWFLLVQNAARRGTSAQRPAGEEQDKIPAFAAVVEMALSLVKTVPEQPDTGWEWGSSLDNGWTQ